MSYKEALTTEMFDHFKMRTCAHIAKVQELAKQSESFFGHIPFLSQHDTSKFEEPEYTPYVALTWKYRCLRLGEEFKLDLPPDVVTKATFHHVKSNRHHPEYWDSSATLAAINVENRDAPAQQVNGRKMPEDCIAEMTLDWLAVAAERKTDVWAWLVDNVPRRWLFTSEQVRLIARIIYQIQNPEENSVRLFLEPCPWHLATCGCGKFLSTPGMDKAVCRVLESCFGPEYASSF